MPGRRKGDKHFVEKKEEGGKASSRKLGMGRKIWKFPSRNSRLSDFSNP